MRDRHFLNFGQLVWSSLLAGFGRLVFSFVGLGWPDFLSRRLSRLVFGFVVSIGLAFFVVVRPLSVTVVVRLSSSFSSPWLSCRRFGVVVCFVFRCC